MRRTSSRQIRRDLVLENDLYTSAKAFEFPVVTIAGANVADSLATNAGAIVTEKNRLDTLIERQYARHDFRAENRLGRRGFKPKHSGGRACGYSDN